jgi:hypothetical protein
MVTHGFNLRSPPATGCSATAFHLGFLGCYGVDDTRGKCWCVASLLSLFRMDSSFSRGVAFSSRIYQSRSILMAFCLRLHDADRGESPALRVIWGSSTKFGPAVGGMIADVFHWHFVEIFSCTMRVWMFLTSSLVGIDGGPQVGSLFSPG